MDSPKHAPMHGAVIECPLCAWFMLAPGKERGRVEAVPCSRLSVGTLTVAWTGAMWSERPEGRSRHRATLSS